MYACYSWWHVNPNTFHKKKTVETSGDGVQYLRQKQTSTSLATPPLLHLSEGNVHIKHCTCNQQWTLNLIKDMTDHFLITNLTHLSSQLYSSCKSFSRFKPIFSSSWLSFSSSLHCCCTLSFSFTSSCSTKYDQMFHQNLIILYSSKLTYFFNHLVHLNPAPILKSTASLHSDLPPSNTFIICFTLIYNIIRKLSVNHNTFLLDGYTNWYFKVI